jgi:hypothetical protein
MEITNTKANANSLANGLLRLTLAVNYLCFGS